MSHRNLIILTKIILFYSLFFIGLKVIVLFQGAWLIPNLVLTIPFVILGAIAGWQVKMDKYSWLLVIIGIITIVVTRIYESRLAFWIQQQFGT